MDFSLGSLWAQMGPFAKFVAITLILMSGVSLVVMVERMVVFARSRRESFTFADKMAKLLSTGDVKVAVAAHNDDKTLARNVGHLGRVINSGIVAYKTSPNDRETAIESVARALERQAAREVQSLKRGLNVLATVGSTAPFIGLMGTVMGIVTAFEKMASSGSGGLGTVSAGIAEALITTAGGLIVAIPAVISFNFLQGWVDGRAVDISESANEFLDVVSKHFAKG
jgi:biopolymer transport protein TolQ